MIAMGIDCDQVLAEFNPAYLRLLKIAMPELDLELDEIDAWAWPAKAGVPIEVEDACWDVIKSNKDFWVNLAPAVESETFDTISSFATVMPVYIITHRPNGYTYSTLDSTLRWLEKHGCSNVSVILTGKKDALVQPLGIRFFIDDKADHVNGVMKEYRKCGDDDPPVIALLKSKSNEKDKLEDGVIVVDTLDEFLDLVYEVVTANEDKESHEEESDQV